MVWCPECQEKSQREPGDLEDRCVSKMWWYMANEMICADKIGWTEWVNNWEKLCPQLKSIIKAYQPHGMQSTLHNTWSMKMLDTLTEGWEESTRSVEAQPEWIEAGREGGSEWPLGPDEHRAWEKWQLHKRIERVKGRRIKSREEQLANQVTKVEPENPNFRKWWDKGEGWVLKGKRRGPHWVSKLGQDTTLEDRFSRSMAVAGRSDAVLVAARVSWRRAAALVRQALHRLGSVSPLLW